VFKEFSPKQKQVFSWWLPGSEHCAKSALICEGAVRSGKTVCMALSFFLWSAHCFNNACFALCGKTIGSLRRNVTTQIFPYLRELNFKVKEKLSQNFAELNFNGNCNRYYYFGGKDEGSAALIQGMTLAGVLFDEVALMPRSFVEQALARCSVAGSRFWFNCNPENPAHWFKREWIDKAKEKNALLLHFKMQDNPSLNAEIRERYNKLYSGAFYERFVLGKWTAAQGLVYPMFSVKLHVRELPDDACPEAWVISCDYGTVNPCSMGLWAKHGGAWYRVREYYFDSRREQYQRTDEEHYAALEQLAGGEQISRVIVDPSAAGFLALIRSRGRFTAVKARNDVIDGIRRVAGKLKGGELFFSAVCKDSLREFTQYCWEENAVKDTPRKRHDHAMDDIRYFVSSMQGGPGESEGFFVGTV
jgi:PBSX family phage terminase large subunit